MTWLVVIAIAGLVGTSAATATTKKPQVKTPSTAPTTAPPPVSTTTSSTTSTTTTTAPAKTKAVTTTTTGPAKTKAVTTTTTVVKAAPTTTTAPAPTTTTAPKVEPKPLGASTPTTTTTSVASPTGVETAKPGARNSGTTPAANGSVCGSSPLGPISNGQTITTSGIVTLTKPVNLDNCTGVTFNGGTWEDPNTSPGKAYGGGVGLGRPAFNIVSGTNITLENLSVVGVNRGGYQEKLAFNGGIETDGTAGLTLTNVNVAHVFGDCLTLAPLRSYTGTNFIVAPVRDLTVNGFSGTACGRQGITLASVDGASMTDVNIGTTGFDPFDAEADQSDGEGARNVTVSQCSFTGLVAISAGGGATGPITFSHCTMKNTTSGDVLLVDNTSAHQPDAGAISFSDDSLRCGASIYVSCLQLNGATDVIVQDTNLTIGFPESATHESVYTMSGNSHIAFTDDVVKGYGEVGTARVGSSATVTGGTWFGEDCKWPNVCPMH
jgi:hypothetical protein